MQISVVRPSELGPGEIARWHSMQASTAALANPFLCPEFAIAVGAFRPDARVAVLTDGQEIAGFFPFQRRRFGAGVPIGAGLADCQGLVHAPGLEWSPAELLRACRLSVWQFDHLAEGQGPFERYAAVVAQSPAIDLDAGFAAYQEKLATKAPEFCSSLARKTRKLQREVGDLRFLIDSPDPQALRTLMRWKSDQYRRTGWTDRFDRQWIVSFIEYLLDARSERFSGLLSLLYAGDSLVAAHFGLRSDRVLVNWFPAYDTQFGKYSPGLIQNLSMAEEAAALGIGLIDLGKGTERYKETFKSRDLFVAEGMVTRRSVLAYAHRGGERAGDWARRSVRKHPLLFNAADRLLRHYGRVG